MKDKNIQTLKLKTWKRDVYVEYYSCEDDTSLVFYIWRLTLETV